MEYSCQFSFFPLCRDSANPFQLKHFCAPSSSACACAPPAPETGRDALVHVLELKQELWSGVRVVIDGRTELRDVDLVAFMC